MASTERSYDQFFAALSATEQALVSHLRGIVLDTFPDFTEKLSYGVPYYFHHRRVCFIWPASVRPGPKAGVMLGFCYGSLMQDDYGVLEKEGRKQVYGLTFHTPGDIRDDLVRALVDEAVVVDEREARERPRR